MPGLLDTVKFKAPVLLSDLDKKHLRDSGFRYQRNVRVMDEGSGEVVAVREMFSNEKNGLRVMADEFDVRIEGSVPRVLGLENVFQESLTEADARTAFDLMTLQALPYTSETIEGAWGLTRLDLARNFKGDVPLIVGAYTQLRHPEIRATTKTMFSQSVMFYGKTREVILYDKGAEIGAVPGKLGRVESRWMGMKGIDKLSAYYAGCRLLDERPREGFYLPVFVKVGDFRRVMYIPTGYDDLNRVMRTDIEKLGSPGPVIRFRTSTEIALHALVHHPEEYKSFLWGMPKATQARWRKKLRAYKERLQDVNVVDLIWGADERRVA